MSETNNQNNPQPQLELLPPPLRAELLPPRISGELLPPQFSGGLLPPITLGQLEANLPNDSLLPVSITANHLPEVTQNHQDIKEALVVEIDDKRLVFAGLQHFIASRRFKRLERKLPEMVAHDVVMKIAPTFDNLDPKKRQKPREQSQATPMLPGFEFEYSSKPASAREKRSMISQAKKFNKMRAGYFRNRDIATAHDTEIAKKSNNAVASAEVTRYGREIRSYAEKKNYRQRRRSFIRNQNLQSKLDQRLHQNEQGLNIPGIARGHKIEKSKLKLDKLKQRVPELEQSKLQSKAAKQRQIQALKDAKAYNKQYMANLDPYATTVAEMTTDGPMVNLYNRTVERVAEKRQKSAKKKLTKSISRYLDGQLDSANDKPENRSHHAANSREHLIRAIKHNREVTKASKFVTKRQKISHDYKQLRPVDVTGWM